jgi:hypothetical protein
VFRGAGRDINEMAEVPGGLWYNFRRGRKINWFARQPRIKKKENRKECPNELFKAEKGTKRRK